MLFSQLFSNNIEVCVLGEETEVTGEGSSMFLFFSSPSSQGAAEPSGSVTNFCCVYVCNVGC